MNKNRIRLTESQLHRVIKESVKRVLKEGEEQTNVKEIRREITRFAYEIMRSSDLNRALFTLDGVKKDLINDYGTPQKELSWEDTHYDQMYTDDFIY